MTYRLSSVWAGRPLPATPPLLLKRVNIKIKFLENGINGSAFPCYNPNIKGNLPPMEFNFVKEALNTLNLNLDK
jgi:hypothetical protein